MRTIFARFRAFGKKLANIQAIIILSLIYVLFVPFLRMVMGKRREKKGWIRWDKEVDALGHAKLQ